MTTDTFVVRMVVGILGIVAVGALAAITVLAYRELGIPDYQLTEECQ